MYSYWESIPLGQELLYSNTFKQLYNLNFIDEISVRNFIIKQEFLSLRSNNVSSSKAIEILCDKYYISHDTICSILYRKILNKKNKILPNYLPFLNSK